MGAGSAGVGGGAVNVAHYRTYPDMPAVGHVVRVWWHTVEIDATWDGARWRTPDGVLLQGPITHWRER